MGLYMIHFGNIMSYIWCSLWDYTNVVMNFLCGPRAVDGSPSLNFDWLQYFDVVITGRSGSENTFI